MRFNLKLSQKGLILVAVPLVFEFIFVIALAAMLEQAESERRQEAHSKAIVSLSNDLSNGLFDAASSIFAWHYTNSQMFQNRGTEATARIRNGIAELKELTSSDPKQRKRARHIAVVADRVTKFLDTFSERIRTGQGSEIDYPTLRKQVSAAYQPFIEELHVLAKEEKQRAIDAPRAERERKKKLNAFLLVGLAVNVLIAVLLSWFFKGITRRLRVLSSNAKLLANKEALNQPLQGTDEIAQLDGVFHEMAEALISAEQRKQEFVSTICHDLRSPLANVQISLALAAKGKFGDLNEKGVERFSKAEKSIDRLIVLLNKLLDAERMEAGLVELEVTKIDLKDVVVQSMDAVRSLADERSVRLQSREEEITLVGDSDRLIRVVINLLSNAIKFSPKGARVSVTMRTVDNTTAEVRISDQGPGIPPEDVEKIFERFHRISNSKGPSGIGLGLTICKKIVEAHKGTIGVESTMGEGSSFWFRLPIQ